MFEYKTFFTGQGAKITIDGCLSIKTFAYIPLLFSSLLFTAPKKTLK
jgi:hypothetical protein